MSVKITTKGEQLILQQITELEQELKQVRFDKNNAYHACGDDRLANPNFHKLEQEERIVEERISELQEKYKTADVVSLQERNTDKVAIGSIVKLSIECINSTEEEVYEIVGYGESNIEDNKIYYGAPIAMPLIGLTIGEEASLSLPSGKAKCKVIDMYSDWDEAFISSNDGSVEKY